MQRAKRRARADFEAVSPQDKHGASAPWHTVAAFRCLSLHGGTAAKQAKGIPTLDLLREIADIGALSRIVVVGYPLDSGTGPRATTSCGVARAGVGRGADV
jgi:hypothetical protein